MKEVRINNVTSYLKEISPLGPFTMYRGQTHDWPLLPSIGRYPKTVCGYEDWKTFHDQIIEEFLRLGRPHFQSYPEKIEGWILAQHYGVPTRLLDTTTNPLKALFFAVDNSVNEVDGVVWAIEFNGWRTELLEQHSKFWENEICPYLPAQYNPRLTAQEGAFILCPLPENKAPMFELDKVKVENIKYSKIIVPREFKPDIRRELDILGCNNRLLFPDLSGVAKGIKLTDLQEG